MTEASNTDPMTIPTDGRIDLDALAELANRLRKTAERCKEAADGETLVGRDTARMAQYRLDEAADAIDLARAAMISASPSPPALDGAGRDAVIEECAKAVRVASEQPIYSSEMRFVAGHRLGVDRSLAAIRALKETP